MTIATIIVNYTTGALVLDHLGAIEAAVKAAGGGPIIIIDNASPNGDGPLLTQGTAQRDDVHVVLAPKNGGFAYGNNRGFEKALTLEASGAAAQITGFWLLNPDARPEVTALRILMDWAASTLKCGVVGGGVEGKDGHPQYAAFRDFTALGEIQRTSGLGILRRALRAYEVPQAPSPPNSARRPCGLGHRRTPLGDAGRLRCGRRHG